MLDSYIIDRIRREREQQERARQVPLRIERQPPPHRPPESAEPAAEAPKRGSIVIDFRL